MAARTRKTKLDQKHKDAIRASQLLNRLTAHGLGKVDMTNSQVNASDKALSYLRPKLAALEHTGDIQQHYIVHMPSPVKDLGEWRQVYGAVEEKPVLQLDAKPAEPIAVDSALPAKDD